MQAEKMFSLEIFTLEVTIKVKYFQWRQIVQSLLIFLEQDNDILLPKVLKYYNLFFACIHLSNLFSKLFFI